VSSRSDKAGSLRGRPAVACTSSAASERPDTAVAAVSDDPCINGSPALVESATASNAPLVRLISLGERVTGGPDDTAVGGQNREGV
jgi:hypothetical protein